MHPAQVAQFSPGADNTEPRQAFQEDVSLENARVKLARERIAGETRG
jgi:hypothetical protein